MGWSTNMAGVNLVGIRDVFGSKALKRVKTCEFHFKQNRNKKARELDQESAQELKDICEALLIAQTTDGYAVVIYICTNLVNDFFFFFFKYKFMEMLPFRVMGVMKNCFTNKNYH